MIDEEQVNIVNPIKPGCNLRLPRPFPMHLKDGQVKVFIEVLKSCRDKAIFLLMLRCGLRVEEVANLSLNAIDFKRRRILIQDGKWGKDRLVYVCNDAMKALINYLKVIPASKTKKVFLVEKGTYRGRPISVRGIQKRMEYYAKKCGLKISCHHLRHTMATQLLNAGGELATIQDLLGHSSIRTT